MFKSLRPGDKVTRLLCGSIPMEITVTKVDDTLVHCGDWTFDIMTGAEVDEDLGWGPQGTGSVLKKES